MAVISACFVMLLSVWSFASQVTEESVLIIKDFGIQLRILYRSGSEETKVSFEATLCNIPDDCDDDINLYHFL